MSFNSKAKDEVISQVFPQKSFFYLLLGLIYSAGVIDKKDSGFILSFRLKGDEIKKFIIDHIESYYHLSPSARQKHLIYDDFPLLKELSFAAQLKPLSTYNMNHEQINIFICGCYLGSGWIKQPKSNSYHLEIFLHESYLAVFLQEQLEKRHIESKVINKRTGYLLYIKKVDCIIDFLSLVGAVKTMYELVDIKSNLDMIISSQRIENCYIYNQMRTLDVAKRQYDDIMAVGIDNLQGLAHTIAKIRLENPEATLNEIADILFLSSQKRISKAGINYYFKQIGQQKIN